MGIKVIEPPVGYPVTLEQARQHLHVDGVDANEDALIMAYVAAATGHAEVFTGRVFVPRVLELQLDRFQPQIMIPRPPLIEVLDLRYDDGNGDEQQLAEDVDFAVDNVSQPGWVVGVNGAWPSTIDTINSVRIRYRAGYLDQTASPPVGGNYPEDLIAAILLMCGSFYSSREQNVVGTIATKLPFGAEELLRQHRVELALA